MIARRQPGAASLAGIGASVPVVRELDEVEAARAQAARLPLLVEIPNAAEVPALRPVAAGHPVACRLA